MPDFNTPYAKWISFLIAAPITTIGHFPRSLSLSLIALITGLCCVATIAGKYIAFLSLAVPILHNRGFALTDEPL